MSIRKRILLALLVAAALSVGSAAWVAEAATTAPANGNPAAQAPADPLEQWLQKSKQPADWIKLGGDLRLRAHYTNNMVTLDKHAIGHETIFQRYRARAWTKIQPFGAFAMQERPDLDVNFRMTWEMYQYCQPEHDSNPAVNARDVDFSEVIIDQLNVKYAKAFGLPVTAVVGRQDIVLGDGWLVLEGTPGDGSRTIFFDAARLTWDFAPIKTTVDTIYLNNHAESSHTLAPINDRDKPLIEQDEQGAIVWAANKSLEKTELDGYFIYKHGERNRPNGYDADLYTFGQRVVGEIGENWRYKSDLAEQFGWKNDQTVCAMGYNSQLAYFLKDRLNNNFRVGYEFLSGDNPNSGTNEAFDVLWGRWVRFSELIPYTYAGETRYADYTNLHRVNIGWSCNPAPKLEWCNDYNLLFANQNTYAGSAGFSDSGNFRGQLLSTLLRYKINPHVEGHAIAEFFFPGDYYSDARNDVAMFLRYEIVFSW